MDDPDIHQTIAGLVDEEHRLRNGTPSEESRERLRHLEERLDQCWDLLRQREALRAAHQDPRAAEARPISEVENYLQ
jgi:hypothetical protein